MIERCRLPIALSLLALLALGGCSSGGGETPERKPVPMLDANMTFGNVRTPFRFDASGSRDAAALKGQLYYRWDLNLDGEPDLPADGSWTTDPVLETKFDTLGDHIVVVFVTNREDAPLDNAVSAGILVTIVDREYAGIETIVGTGVAGSSAEGSLAAETELFTTMDITIGPDDTPYIVDWQNHKIMEIRDGRTYSICGTGTLGDAPEGPATTAGLNHPTNISVDPQGRLILAAWHNSMVMRIDPDLDSFVRVAGIRPLGGTNSNRCYEPTDEGGPAVDACLDLPSSTAFDSEGNLYISDQKNVRVVKVAAVGGVITDHNETGTQSSFETIVGVPCADPSDPAAENCPDGGFNGNGILATQAYLRAPGLQSADPTSRIIIHDDVLYIADTENHQIRSVDLKLADPTIELVAGTNDTDAFGKPLSGPPIEGVLAAGAKLNRPCDIAMDADGNLFIADTKNNVVRRVDAGTGEISTIAGNHAANPACLFNGQCETTDSEAFGDGGDPRDAYLALPYGIDLDSQGNLYIVDTYHHRVRIVYK